MNYEHFVVLHIISYPFLNIVLQRVGSSKLMSLILDSY